MKTLNYVWIALLLAPIAGVAQQLGQFDQYMNNAILQNPAFVGMEEFTEIRGNFRRQWVGFDNAPRSFVLSASSRLMTTNTTKNDIPPSIFISDNELYNQLGGERKVIEPSPHGIGGYVIHDRNGPFERISAFATYAYHLRVTEKTNLSFGVGAGFSRREIDLASMSVLSGTDELYNSYLMNDNAESHLDLKAGLTYYGRHFFVGYSSNQLLQNEVYDVSEGQAEKLAIHHYLSGGYVFNLSERFELYPTVMVRYVEPAPLAYDANLRARLDKEVWFGVGYRYQDAVSGQIGLTLNNKLNFGYTYAFGTSEIREAHDGTHEVSLGFMFNNKQPAPSKLW
jgi:type IX secretion system PorP/SprF family membrane protein